MKFSRAESILNNPLLGAEAFPWTTKAANELLLSEQNDKKGVNLGPSPCLPTYLHQNGNQMQTDSLALKNVYTY